MTQTAAKHDDLTAQVLAMGPACVRWAVAHPDYYQVMFGAETDETDKPELLTAGMNTFATLLDVIVRCQGADILADGDPRDIAGPVWSLLHGIASLAIDGDLHHVGIEDDPQALADRALKGLLFEPL